MTHEWSDGPTWCEIDATALSGNVARFRRLVGQDVLLAPTVKANAYGHGLLPAARAFLDGGADWLCVNALYEARALRAAGVDAPLYVMGPIGPAGAHEAVALGCRVMLCDEATLAALAEAAPAARPARVHLKLETGTQRQGLPPAEALALGLRAAALPCVEVEGVASHFANVEDTTDHSYARRQRACFEEFLAAAETAGLALPIRHFSNSAATLLWPDSWYDMVRLGIGAYGMWPSSETRVAAALAGRQDAVRLEPALTWKTRIAQLKTVAPGEYVGYGLTFRCSHASRLAILPVGYYDGYDRHLSNQAHVLVRGRRAPVRGRICMNLTIVDTTDVADAEVGDQVVLLGSQGDETVSAETLAAWIGTINYEVTTRIHERIQRRVAPLAQNP